MCVWGPERARDRESAAAATVEEEAGTGNGYNQGYISDLSHGFWYA